MRKSLLELFHQSLVYCLDEVQSIQIGWSWDVVSSMHANGQIFCHLAVLHAFNGGFFQSMAELGQIRVIVELSSVQETTSPSEDAGNGVGRCLSSLLMFAIMPGDGSMGSFCLNSSIGSIKDWSHESQRSIAWICYIVPCATKSDWTSPS